MRVAANVQHWRSTGIRTASAWCVSLVRQPDKGTKFSPYHKTRLAHNMRSEMRKPARLTVQPITEDE